VIIPIYNTGRYLDEAIFSLLNQTIGFKNIQLILVNDGSIDQTEEISLKYKKAYPKNIIYIKIEHGGKSKAKNIGLDYATGKYITFLDPDDKWDSKAFNYILFFFKNK
jgi:glycosyltransferase involved in cell wall biosynthesis